MLQPKTKPNTMPDHPSMVGKSNKPKKPVAKSVVKKTTKANEQIGRVISIKDGIALFQD